MGMILRPVSLAIAAAAASSGSLRRAQMATSIPSRANTSAMPRPMPSLPPVTRAVLPLSCRSIFRRSPLSLNSSARLVREPCAGLGGGKQIGERRIERRRLLAGDGVTGARDHQQRGRRRGTLHEQAAVETKLILVA